MYQIDRGWKTHQFYTLFIHSSMSHTQTLTLLICFWRNLSKRCLSSLRSAFQIDAARLKSEVHLQLKTRWHICSWLAQTGRNGTFSVAGLFFRTSLSRQADFWQRAQGRSRPRISTNPWAEWEGAGLRWQGVGRGLSCDPDSCTGLCPGGERRFSSFISLRAGLLTVINAVMEGERERDSGWWKKRKSDFEFQCAFMQQVMHYGLLFGETCKWETHEIFVYTVFVYLLFCVLVLWRPPSLQELMSHSHSGGTLSFGFLWDSQVLLHIYRRHPAISTCS